MTESSPTRPDARPRGQTPVHPAPVPETRATTAEKKGGLLRSAARHPGLSLLILLVMMVGALIGQNLEPTRIDFLFWTLLDVPKVVLLIIGVPVGALGWELLRRAFR